MFNDTSKKGTLPFSAIPIRQFGKESSCGGDREKRPTKRLRRIRLELLFFIKMGSAPFSCCAPPLLRPLTPAGVNQFSPLSRARMAIKGPLRGRYPFLRSTLRTWHQLASHHRPQTLNKLVITAAKKGTLPFFGDTYLPIREGIFVWRREGKAPHETAS